MSTTPAKGGSARAKKKVRYGKLDIFSLYWRLGRVRYIGYTFGFLIVAFLLASLAKSLVLMLPLSISGYFMSFSLVLIYGGLALITIMLTIKRCHDFDTSGWFSLLLLVPYGMLIFWFIPGTDSVNRFGRDLPPNSLWEKTLAIVAVVALLIGTGAVLKSLGVFSGQGM